MYQEQNRHYLLTALSPAPGRGPGHLVGSQEYLLKEGVSGIGEWKSRALAAGCGGQSRSDLALTLASVLPSCRALGGGGGVTSRSLSFCL